MDRHSHTVGEPWNHAPLQNKEQGSGSCISLYEPDRGVGNWHSKADSGNAAEFIDMESAFRVNLYRPAMGGQLKDKFVIEPVESQSEPVEPDNATLKPEDATLKPENATLKPEDATLKPEDATLKPEDATLKPENATLKPEDATLKPENATLKQMRL